MISTNAQFVVDMSKHGTDACPFISNFATTAVVFTKSIVK